MATQLPPPRPKSPPKYPDLNGRRREISVVQNLEREIGFLEAEVRFVESLQLQPASRFCKEVSEFVVANSDPLIPTHDNTRRCWRFWKWLCGSSCLKLWSFCCCCHSKCSCYLNRPKCIDTAVHVSDTLLRCSCGCSSIFSWCKKPSFLSFCFWSTPCCCRNIKSCCNCPNCGHCCGNIIDSCCKPNCNCCCCFRFPSCSDYSCCDTSCCNCSCGFSCCECKKLCSDPCCLPF